MLTVEEIKRSAQEMGKKDLVGWAFRLAGDLYLTEEFMFDSVNQVRGLIAQIEVTEDNAWPILLGLVLGLGLGDDPGGRTAAGGA